MTDKKFTKQKKLKIAQIRWLAEAEWKKKDIKSNAI